MSDEKTNAKRPVGRPTDYDEKFCDMLVEHMGEGLSFEAFAGLIGVCKQTLFNWEKIHPEFLDSKERGIAKSLLWWEKAGIEGLWSTSEKSGKDYSFTRTFNGGVWSANMRNRFKWDKPSIDDSENENENNNMPKVIVYLPKNGREAPPSIEPAKQQQAKKKKKKK